MADIAPELYEKISSEFGKKFAADKKIQALYEVIADNRATYEQVNEFAIRVGDICSEVLRTNLTADILPDGRLYYNIAERTVRPALTQNYELVSEVAEQVQNNLNADAGLGLKAVNPPLNEDRVVGIVDKVSNAENIDDVAWMLGEPIVNFTQSVVDDYIKSNAEFQYKAGLSARIKRTTAFRCCEWCANLAGTYLYPDVPHDVYRRHEFCRCTVDYRPGDGRRQNVHSKQWTTTEESDTLEARKHIGIAETREFKSEQLLTQHYGKHAEEFGVISKQGYLQNASKLADMPDSDDVKSLTRSDNSISKYKISTNEFVVINSDGTIRTYFKPVDKEAYWQYELDRN